MASSKTAGGATGGRKEFGTVIGIDLGTTFSCVGVYEDGQVEIIANDQGNRTTPSYVAFSKEGERLIGEAARNQLTTNPENTVFDVKRLIGRSWDDPMVQKNIQNYPFKVINKNSKPYIQLKVGRETKTFAPEEISAMVLGRMKKTAEEHIGEEVTHAVVTVPAYFNDAQRQATKDAAMIADLKVLRILNEPTAAAFAYGFKKKIENETIVVFDLGGGTFDVTILEMKDNKEFKVLATNGNTNLGGEDFDQEVVDYLIANKIKQDIKLNDKARQKLRVGVEKAKRELSKLKQSRIVIDSLMPSLEFSELLTRATFEDLNMDYFTATLDPVRQVLDDAKLQVCQLDRVLLVGGSSRIPKIKELVTDLCKGKELSRGINPDEAVAFGATVMAASFWEQLDAQNTPILVDVNPLSLGVDVKGDIISVIIPRNTPLPAKQTKEYMTWGDDHTSVLFKIYEGERSTSSENHKLGELVLDDIPAAPRGVEKLDCTFEVDNDGILLVTAEVKGTDIKRRVIINNESRHTRKDIDRMIAEAKRFAEQDRSRLAIAEFKNDLDMYVYELRRRILGKRPGQKYTDAEKDILENALADHDSWLKRYPDANLNAFKAERQRIESIVSRMASN